MTLLEKKAKSVEFIDYFNIYSRSTNEENSMHLTPEGHDENYTTYQGFEDILSIYGVAHSLIIHAQSILDSLYSEDSVDSLPDLNWLI